MLIGHGLTGTLHDFFAFNEANDVWNGSAFVNWADGDFTTYRVAAAEIGTSGRFTGTIPVGTVSYVLRMRDAVLANSTIVDQGFLLSFAVTTGTQVMRGVNQGGDPCDFFAFNSANLVWNGTTFVPWVDGNFTTYRVAAVQQGTARTFEALAPVGTETYELRIRDALLVNSAVIDGGGFIGVATPFTPSLPSQVTGVMVVYDNEGLPKADVAITAIVGSLPHPDDLVIYGAALDQTPRVETSDALGVVQFTNLFKGVTYVFKRGTSTFEHLIQIPLDAASPYTLPSIFGKP